jgi:hypothetical protein
VTATQEDESNANQYNELSPTPGSFYPGTRFLASFMMTMGTALFAGCADDGYQPSPAPSVPATTLGAHSRPAIVPNLAVDIICVDAGCETTPGTVEILSIGTPPKDWDRFENTRDQRERAQATAAQTESALGELGIACAQSLDGHGIDEDGWAIDEARVLVRLVEEPFDFYRFRAAGNDESGRALHAALKAEREAQLRPGQDAIAEAVRDFDGHVIGRLRLVNAVMVSLPVCNAPLLARLPRVSGIEWMAAPVLGGFSADGQQRRSAVGLPTGNYLDVNGGQGSWRSGTPRVRVGVIESDNSLNTSHLSFRDGSGTATRIVDTDRCNYWFPTYYRCINSATTTTETHGTLVTSVLLSDLTQGQDAGYTSQSDRQIRSGSAREAEVHYDSAADMFAASVALDEAVLEDGIDIVNMSMGPKDGVQCSMQSRSTVREEIEAATSAGVLVVAAAGNFGAGDCPEAANDPTCTVNDFAFYPDSLAVGGTNM